MTETKSSFGKSACRSRITDYNGLIPVIINSSAGTTISGEMGCFSTSVTPLVRLIQYYVKGPRGEKKNHLIINHICAWKMPVDYDKNGM